MCNHHSGLYTAPPQADITVPELQELINRQHWLLGTASLVAGNMANLTQVMPELKQNIDFPMRRGNTLDHCYMTFKETYKAVSRLGKSDNATKVEADFKEGSNAALVNGTSQTIKVSPYR